MLTARSDNSPENNLDLVFKKSPVSTLYSPIKALFFFSTLVSQSVSLNQNHLHEKICTLAELTLQETSDILTSFSGHTVSLSANFHKTPERWVAADEDEDRWTDIEKMRVWDPQSSVYSAKDLFTLRWEEDGHPRVICAEQWAASAPEGIADPKIHSEKTHCKAQPSLEHSGIRISLNSTAARSTAMVTRGRGRTSGYTIHDY